MTQLGQGFEDLIREGVEEFCKEYDFKDQIDSVLEDHDFSDAIKDVIKDEIDVEDTVQKAIDDFDFSDSINECVKDYDWWEEIEAKAKDEIETCVDNARDELQSEISERLASPEFKGLVRAVVVSIIKEAVRGCWQSIKDWLTWPWRKMRERV